MAYDDMIKYWEKEYFNPREWKWSPDIEKSLLDLWDEKKEDARRKDDLRAKTFVDNFEKYVEDDLKKEELLPKMIEFADKKREYLSDEGWWEGGGTINEEAVRSSDRPFEIVEEISKGPESRITGAKYIKGEGLSVVLEEDFGNFKKGDFVTLPEKTAERLKSEGVARNPKRSEIPV